MLSGKSFAALAVVTAVAVGAAAMLQTGGGAIARSGELVFPELLSKINDLARVEGLHAGAQFTLERRDGRWVVAERAGYPADANKVHELLVGTAGLRRLEPKTANPALFDKVGLGDPSTAQARSARYRLASADGAVLAEVLTGDRRSAKTSPDGEEIYIRAPGEERSWLVEGRLPGAKSALDWLDKAVVKLGRERIREVVVRHADGEVVTVRKSTPGQADFELAEGPGDPESEQQWKINDIGRFAADLALADVKPAADVEFPATPAERAVTTTFDGLQIAAETTVVGETTYARFTVEVDESLRVEPPAEADAGGWDALADREAVRAEVERLSRRWAGWVYALPSHKAAYLAQRRTDLVTAKGDGAGDPEAAPAQPGASG